VGEIRVAARNVSDDGERLDPCRDSGGRAFVATCALSKFRAQRHKYTSLNKNRYYSGM
jgi:hypothetical protein